MIEDVAEAVVRVLGDNGAEIVNGYMTDVDPNAAVRVDNRTAAADRRRMRVDSLIGTAVPLAFALFSVCFFDGRGKLTMAAIWVACAVPGIYMTAEAFGARLEWDRTTLHARSPWHRPWSVPWDAIEAVDYSTFGGYALRFGSCGTIRVGDLMAGSAVVVRLARSHVRRLHARPVRTDLC